MPVGKVIAILAEEGDDISNLEVPKEDEASSSSASSSTSSSAPPAPEAQSESSSPPPAAHHGEANLSHARPLFPSVLRLLQEHGADASKITGTGIRGMLTKGDVLAFLGKASGPTGSFKVDNKVKDGPAPTAGGKAPAKEAPKAVCFAFQNITSMRGRLTLRSALAIGRISDSPAYREQLAQRIQDPSWCVFFVFVFVFYAKNPLYAATPSAVDFDSIIDDYLPRKPSVPKSAAPLPPPKAPSSDFLAGLL